MSRPLTAAGASGRRPDGPLILVTPVGTATGSMAAAAALACVASEPDRAALLIDLDGERAPRPSLLATAGARELEERLAAHRPDAAVASRGRLCQLTLPAGLEAVETMAAATPLVRESAAVVHLPPGLLHPLLEESSIRPTGVLLRADLARDRALTALAVRELLASGLRVAVLKRPLSRPVAVATRFGALPAGGPALPARLVSRLFDPARVTVSQRCYSRQHDSEAEPARAAQPERRDHARAGRGPGLHRHPQRSAGR